jgi:hypothetical protein
VSRALNVGLQDTAPQTTTAGRRVSFLYGKKPRTGRETVTFLCSVFMTVMKSAAPAN